MKQQLWKTLLVVCIQFIAVTTFAAEPFACGEYEFKGVLRKVDGKNVLKLYEGSLSETTMSLSADLQELAEVNLGNPVTLKGKMFKPVEAYRGEIESTLTEKQIKELTAPDKPYTARFMRDDIKERVPDPLDPAMDSGMKLIKKLPCRGKETPVEPKKKPKKK